MKRFNHDAQQMALERAERYLRGNGQDELAGAISRAIALYVDMQGRVAQSRRIGEQLETMRENLNNLVQDNDKYVANYRLPWIEPVEAF